MAGTQQFTDADSFLDALSPRALSEDRRGVYIYRGQQDARWKLLPSALRDGVKFPTGQGLMVVDWDRQTVADQRYAELMAAKEFFERADHQGLAFPEDSQSLRRQLRESWTVRRQPLHEWPKLELRSLFAIAQHHGVPTRLLDWTRNHFVAAYFAASKLLPAVFPKDAEIPAELAVWVLNTYSLDPEYQRTIEARERATERNVGGTKENSEFPDKALELVTVTGSTSPNVRAQEGLFTVLREGVVRGDRLVQRRSLEDALPSSTDHLTKFTLTVSEVPRLLRALHSEGFDAARVRPGYDGIVDAITEARMLSAVEFTDKDRTRVTSRARARALRTVKPTPSKRHVIDLKGKP